METLTRLGERFRPQQSNDFESLVEEAGVEPESYVKHAKSRSRTDTPFLVAHGLFLLILAFLLGYCVLNGDIDRITKGYDNCGNVCGKKNDFTIQHQQQCKAEDMTGKPYLVNIGTTRKCVTECDVIDGYNCLSMEPYRQQWQDDMRQMQTFLARVNRSLHLCLYEVVSLIGIALAFSIAILLMLRYMAMVFVWFCMFGVLLASAAATAYFGHLSYLTGDEYFFRLTFISGITTLIVVVMTVIVASKISLVIGLLKETEKSIASMPLLLFEPILTVLALFATWSAWFYFTLWTQSVGAAEEVAGHVLFIPDSITLFTDWYNLFAMVWMVQLVCCCQNMLIAGAVSAWYFAKDKMRLRSPISHSMCNMVTFHLGTVSFGSLIIAILQMIRVIFALLRRASRGLFCIDFCVSYLEGFVRFFTKNSFVMTSIHGYGFREAGSRAFRLLVDNAMQVVAVTSAGDCVLIMGKLLVVACAVPIGHFMIQSKGVVEDEWVLLILVGLMAFVIAHCFIGVYEMAIDTICLCFCEDCDVNDGVSRPYYMSQEMMNFIKESQASLKRKEPKNSGSSATELV